MDNAQSNISAAEAAQLEMAQIQQQLRMERARLADEIGSRFDALSSASTSKNKLSSPSTTTTTFTHRPVNLGVGAESTSTHDTFSREDKRLRGALMGKRKGFSEPSSSDMQQNGKVDEEDDIDSKASMMGTSSAKSSLIADNASKNKKRKADPFAAPTKGKQKSKIDHPTINGHTSATNNGSTSLSSTEIPANLSKKARKKLRKQLAQQQNGNVADSISKEEVGEEASVNEDMIVDQIHPKQIQPSQPTSSSALPSKLAGARFRQINETMYTTTSKETLAMVQQDPIKFTEYHDGFQEQTKSWPKNPVKQIFEMIKHAQLEQQGKKTMMQNGNKKGLSAENGQGRYAKGALIVDLGAGTGSLAKWIQAEQQQKWSDSHPRVLSYDLLDSQDGFVKGLDIAKIGGIPLPGKEITFLHDGSEDEDLARVVDVAVFCLSLMATNWIDKIREASRIVRPLGELIIAEVTSRFTNKEEFKRVIGTLGFQFQSEDSSNTHFIIFVFRKKPFHQINLPFSNHSELDTFVQSGQRILKPCIYKRR